jgi:hypothetical protein
MVPIKDLIARVAVFLWPRLARAIERALGRLCGLHLFLLVGSAADSGSAPRPHR